VELTPFLSQQTLRFALFGIATGSLYALVSLGIVLAYRASRVLNFSAGAGGAIGAFIFYSLRDSHGVPWVLALIVSLAIGAGLGVLTQLALGLIRSASLIAKVIVTLGLMTLAQGIITVAWGGGSSQPNSFLPDDPVKLSHSLSLPKERFIIVGLVLVLALVLRLVYSRTVFGLATSAVAEDRQVAATSGWSPSVIELVNFALAGLLSTLAAILLAPTVTLNGAVLTLTVLPALAAALVGRFSSFGLTVVGAMVIGVLQSELSLFQPNLAKTFHVGVSSLTGLQDVVPLVIILAVTVASGRVRPARGEMAARLPLPGTGRVFAPALLAAFVVGVVLLYTVPAAWTDALVTTFAMGIVLLSVVVVTGYAGQLSLSQFALAGFGAWLAARLDAVYNLPLELALVLGILGTVPLGLLVALPALRTRGIQLAVATLALAQMITALIFMNGSLTGGFTGTQIKTPKFFGINIDPVAHPERYGVFVLVWFVLAALVVANVRRGRAGRRLLAVRSNERAAASLGIGVYGAKLYAFGLAAGVAGLAGILLAFRNTSVQFQSFDVVGSITAVLYSVLGGVGWIAGSVVGAAMSNGAILNQILTQVFSGVGSIGGILLIVAGVSTVLIFRMAPDGVAGQLTATLPKPVTGLIRRYHEVTARSGPAPAEPRRDRPPATLDVRDVSVAFGGVVALDQVSFTLRPGEVLGLIGPNGAGKTTMLDVITGFTAPRGGGVSLGDAPLDRATPERRARAGMARSWQAVELFNEMTIRDNLLVAADRHQASRYFIDLLRPGRQGTTEVMTEVIDEFGLTPYLDVRPPEVSQGIARLVGIARSIATEPAVLLLDEPAAGLDAAESTELGTAIRRVADQRGIGVLLVEHDVDLLLTICDRIVVLDFGRKIAEGTPEEITSNPAVIRAYLGEPMSTPVPAAEPVPVPAAEPVPAPAAVPADRDGTDAEPAAAPGPAEQHSVTVVQESS
jgi:ABC-type branched-subunit amino acid transport system ATPase component/ABC-type branched-subunit amino acid transport system permease subunit